MNKYKLTAQEIPERRIIIKNLFQKKTIGYIDRAGVQFNEEAFVTAKECKNFANISEHFNMFFHSLKRK